MDIFNAPEDPDDFEQVIADFKRIRKQPGNAMRRWAMECTFADGRNVGSIWSGDGMRYPISGRVYEALRDMYKTPEIMDPRPEEGINYIRVVHWDRHTLSQMIEHLI